MLTNSDKLHVLCSPVCSFALSHCIGFLSRWSYACVVCATWFASTMSKMAALALLVGKYVFEYSENVDEYLGSLGCGLVVRRVLSAMRPALDIEYDPISQKWKIAIDYVIHKYELGFELGEFVECGETFDIRRCRTVVKMDEEDGATGTLVMTQIPEEGPPVTTWIAKLPTGQCWFKMESGGEKASLIFRPFAPPPPQNENVENGIDLNAVD